jgi:hypothetical protein
MLFSIQIGPGMRMTGKYSRFSYLLSERRAHEQQRQDMFLPVPRLAADLGTKNIGTPLTRLSWMPLRSNLDNL